MKKALALVLTGMMAVSCPVMAFAEEADVALDYTMIEEDVYEGTWVTAFNVFDLYLPSDWNIVYNAEADEVPEDGVYFLAQDETETRSVAISYGETEMKDLASLAEAFTAQGFEEVMFVTINEIPVVTYSVLVDDVATAGIAAITTEGGLYNVTLGAPKDDDDFQAIARNIIVSFSNPEVEAETEAE